MEGFEDTPSVVGFLERAGWPGSISHAASTVEFFEDRGAFADVSLNFNVKATGVEPALGITFHMKRRTDPPPGRDDRRRWPALLDGLRELGLADPQEASEMAGWPDARMTTSETLIGRSGAFVPFRGVTHFKLALVGERLRQAKAYIVWLLCLPQALAGHGLTIPATDVIRLHGRMVMRARQTQASIRLVAGIDRTDPYDIATFQYRCAGVQSATCLFAALQAIEFRSPPVSASGSDGSIIPEVLARSAEDAAVQGGDGGSLGHSLTRNAEPARSRVP